MVSQQKGTVYRVSGPVVTAVGIKPAMYDIVRVGDERLMGEVITLRAVARGKAAGLSEDRLKELVI